MGRSRCRRKLTSYFYKKYILKSDLFLSLTNTVAFLSVYVITRFSNPAATGDAVATHLNSKRTLSKNIAITIELIGICCIFYAAATALIPFDRR